MRTADPAEERFVFVFHAANMLGVLIRNLGATRTALDQESYL